MSTLYDFFTFLRKLKRSGLCSSVGIFLFKLQIFISTRTIYKTQFVQDFCYGKSYTWIQEKPNFKFKILCVEPPSKKCPFRRTLLEQIAIQARTTVSYHVHPFFLSMWYYKPFHQINLNFYHIMDIN